MIFLYQYRFFNDLHDSISYLFFNRLKSAY
nr:MAG TPA: hypothetical protein [Caudoviricetes sp.]